jgi:hypothetical protein
MTHTAAVLDRLRNEQQLAVNDDKLVLAKSFGLAIEEIATAWEEATRAWAVCASIHREYAKGKDAVFKTRQADFTRHEAQARARITPLTTRKD